MITTQCLAKVLFEELERDGWGDIEPEVFERVADGDGYVDLSRDRNTSAMKKVLDRVVKRLESGECARGPFDTEKK